MHRAEEVGAAGASLHLSYSLLFTESLQATMAVCAETATRCLKSETADPQGAATLSALVERLRLPRWPAMELSATQPYCGRRLAF